MKRVLGHCLAGVTLVTGGIGIFAACVHDDQSLFVQDVLYPTPVAVGNSCTYSTDPNQSYLPRGTLDLAFTREYDPTYLLGNQLVQRANPQQQQVETSTINIQGAVVRITDAAGNQLTTFTSLTSGTVYPSTGSVPGYTPVQITAIDPTTANNLEKQGLVTSVATSTGNTFVLVTYAKFFGHTLGGTYIESNEFEFPVDVCKGCLVLFTSNDIAPGFKAPNCIGNATTGSSSSSLPVPCRTGQDTFIDCTQCQSVPECLGRYASTGNPVTDAGGGG